MVNRYKRIPAQPVKYKSIRFRSTLEARWAYFFDLFDVRWQYEPTTFRLSDRSYTPDFFVRLNVYRRGIYPLYVEIKPSARLTNKEVTKAHVFTRESGKFLMFIRGVPHPRSLWQITWWRDKYGIQTVRPAILIDDLILIQEEAMHELRKYTLDTNLLSMMQKARERKFTHTTAPQLPR